MSSIVVTGGSGFIGSNLINRLLEKGYTVHNIDIAESQHFHDDKYYFHKNDILDSDSIENIMKNTDVIFHLASIVGVDNVINNPIKTQELIIQGTYNVLDIARRYNKKLTIVSTSEVYGRNPNMPVDENSDSVFGSTNYTRWVYGMSKCISEIIALDFVKKYNVKLNIVRPFNVVGPGQSVDKGMVIPKFIYNSLNNIDLCIYGNGQQKRCFTHVYDFIEAMIGLMEKECFDGEIYNIGSSNPISIESLAYKIKMLCNSKSNISYVPYKKVYRTGYEDINIRVPDTHKIENTLGCKVIHRTIDDIIKDILNKDEKFYE